MRNRPLLATAGALGALIATVVTGAARADESATRACITAVEQGQALRDEGKYRSARDALAKCAAESCPAVIRKDCAQMLSDVDQTGPTVVVIARDATGRDVFDVRLLVDGAVLAETLDGKPLIVDTGDHLFRYERAGGAVFEQRVMIHAAEKNRILNVQLGGAAAPVSQPATPASSAAETSSRTETSGGRTAGYVLLGVGAVGVGVGTFFGLRAMSQESDASMLCPDKVCPTQAGLDAHDDASRSALISTLGFGVGLVAAGAGVYFLLASSSKEKEHALWVAPRIGSGASGLGAGGRF